MPFATTMIFAVLSAMCMTFALPAATRSETCSPNFASKGLSVPGHNFLEWTTGSSPGAGALVYIMTQNLTSLRANRIARRALHHQGGLDDLVVSFSNVNGSLMIDNIVESKDRQQWNVQCSNCEAGRNTGCFAAMGCQIISVNSVFCVKASDAAEALLLVECNGSDSQNFNFFVTV